MEKIEILLGKELPEESKIEKMCKDANVNFNKVSILIDEFNSDNNFVTDEVVSKMYKNSNNKSKKVSEILNVLTFAHIDICEEDNDVDREKYLTDIKNIVNESNYKNLDKFYTSVLNYIESNDDNKFSLDSIVSDNQSSTNYVDKLISNKEEKKEDKHVTVTINRTIEDKVLDMIEENSVKDEEEKQEQNKQEEQHISEEKQDKTELQSNEKNAEKNKDIENPVVLLLNDEDKIEDAETIDNNIKTKISDIKNKIPVYLKSFEINIPEKHFDKISEKINNLVDILYDITINPSDENYEHFSEFTIDFSKYILNIALPKYIKVKDIITYKKENEIRKILKEISKHIVISKDDFDVNCSDEIKNKLNEMLEDVVDDVKTKIVNMKKIKVTTKPKYEGIYNMINMLKEESK